MSYIFNVAGVAMRGEQKDVELMDMPPLLAGKNDRPTSDFDLPR